MRLNKRGFAVTSIIYSMLVLFLALLLLITSNLASRKVLFDKEKNEILDKLNGSISCRLLEDNTLVDSITIGDKYSCNFGDRYRNFYVLEVNNSTETVSLILEGNYDTSTQSWCASGDDNSCAADGLTAKLEEIASAWSLLDRIQIGIPSMKQIMLADSRDEAEYLEHPQLKNEWLYIYPDCDTWGSSTLDEYWTSTPANDEYGSSNAAWVVNASGYVLMDGVNTDHFCGVRPVVNVSIDVLS